MRKILEAKGFNFQTNAELEIVKDIKEKMCHVVIDYESEKKAAEEVAPPCHTYARAAPAPSAPRPLWTSAGRRAVTGG